VPKPSTKSVAKDSGCGVNIDRDFSVFGEYPWVLEELLDAESACEYKRVEDYY